VDQTDGFSPLCSPLAKPPPPSPSPSPAPAFSAPFVNVDVTSFASRMSHASLYSGSGGTMRVWLTDTAGNDPFTGEWEYRMMPGATMKQIGCDLFRSPHPPHALPNGGVRAIAFAYETTRRGELTPAAETALLASLKLALYNSTQ